MDETPTATRVCETCEHRGRVHAREVSHKTKVTHDTPYANTGVQRQETSGAIPWRVNSVRKATHVPLTDHPQLTFVRAQNQRPRASWRKSAGEAIQKEASSAPPRYSMHRPAFGTQIVKDRTWENTESDECAQNDCKCGEGSFRGRVVPIRKDTP